MAIIIDKHSRLEYKFMGIFVITSLKGGMYEYLFR